MKTKVYFGERASLEVKNGQSLSPVDDNDFVTRKLLEAAGILNIADLGSSGVRLVLNGRIINLEKVGNSLSVAKQGNELNFFRHAKVEYTTESGINVRVVPEKDQDSKK